MTTTEHKELIEIKANTLANNSRQRKQLQSSRVDNVTQVKFFFFRVKSESDSYRFQQTISVLGSDV